MLSLVRAPLPPRTNTASQDTITYEDGRAILQFNPPDNEFAMTHTVPPTTTAHGDSLAQPPLHFHTHQEEFFCVKKGTARFYLGTSKVPFATAKTDDTIHIPAGRYHRFENASETQNLVIGEKKTPENHERDQHFFRNLFGYLDDCKKAKVEPSVFQLVVFANVADTPLALPAPFGIEVLGYWYSRLLTSVLAFVGRAMGYQESYPEYYQDRRGL